MSIIICTIVSAVLSKKDEDSRNVMGTMADPLAGVSCRRKCARRGELAYVLITSIQKSRNDPLSGAVI
jgi:hypothetical protein